MTDDITTETHKIGMSRSSHALSVDHLALLFTQLKRFEASGLPTFQAFAVLLPTAKKLHKPLSAMQQQLTAGRPISEAGFRAGLFNDTHKTLVHAGEASGRLFEVYGLLADYYSGLSSRTKKVKSRLYLPVTVLTIALFVQPLPALVAEDITVLGYLQLSVGRLAMLALAAFALVKLTTFLSHLGVERTWHRLQLRLPPVKNWIVKRQINTFIYTLAMMLDSGIPFATALPKAVATIKNSCLRDEFTAALKTANSGMGVYDTLAKAPTINHHLLQIVNSSEQSGKLASGLLHYARLQANDISLQDDALAEWLPRLVYAAIALWMGYSILATSMAPRISANF